MSFGGWGGNRRAGVGGPSGCDSSFGWGVVVVAFFKQYRYGCAKRKWVSVFSRGIRSVYGLSPPVFFFLPSAFFCFEIFVCFGRYETRGELNSSSLDL